MKLPILLLSSAATLLAASAQADAPSGTKNSANAIASATSVPGTKGTLYGDLPIGVFSDDYVNAKPPTKVSPLPSHLMLKTADGMSFMSDRSNPEGFSPVRPLMSCLAENNQLQAARPISPDGSSTRSIRSVQLVEAAEGATLVTDSILLRNGVPAGAFHHGSLPLKKLETLAGGLVVYGARDERPDHRYVHFVVKPPTAPDARGAGSLHATTFSSDGRFQTTSSCGFVLVSLPLVPDSASTAQVRVNTVLAVTDIEAPRPDSQGSVPSSLPPRSEPSSQEVISRPLAIGFSASQLGADPEPRVGISAAWKGDEVVQRVFSPRAPKRKPTID